MFEAIHRWAATLGARLGPFVLLGLALGCASTTLTSIVNPPWRTTELRRVVVFFETDDPGVRRSFEESFGRRAGITSVEFIPSYTLSRGQPIAGDEFGHVANEHRVDALLSFTQEEAGASEPTTLLPADSVCPSGFPVGVCGTAGGISTLQQLWASYSVTLVDPATAVMLWKANATSIETDFATWEDLRNSLTDKTVEQLLEDGVISR